MLTLRSATVGFKEWSFVCEALAAGRQSLILRKGGIAEGRGGFQWQARRFLLFPTHFHEQAASLVWTPSPEALAAAEAPETVRLTHGFILEATALITDWPTAAALAPHHVWKEHVIRERFGYGDQPGLSLAFGRVHRLPEPVILPMEKRFGGCRSWLDLPELEAELALPVLDDATHATRREELARLVPNLTPAA